MKKLYLYALTVSALLITTSAKSQCPNPDGLAFPFIYSSSCYVYVTATLPNADIVVYDGLDQINTTNGQTDASGIGSVFYDCSRSISRILLTRPDGTVCEIPSNRIAAPAALPVKLSSFKANVKANNTATITWTSVMELESSTYIVERSTNGNTFTAIGEVPAAGNSLSTIRYTFDDPGLGDQAVFYRLKMVDIDGRFEYSKVAYVNNKKGSSAALKIFPNPFSSDVQLLGISTTDVNRKNIRLYTITGKEVKYTISGANAITVDAGTAPGIYILRVKDKTFRLVKK